MLAGANLRFPESVDVHRIGKGDDALPLLPCKHAVETLRRRFGRRAIRIVEVGGIRPRSTDAHIRRPQRGRQLASPQIRQIDGPTVLIHVGVHPGGTLELG